MAQYNDLCFGCGKMYRLTILKHNTEESMLAWVCPKIGCRQSSASYLCDPKVGSSKFCVSGAGDKEGRNSNSQEAHGTELTSFFVFFLSPTRPVLPPVFICLIHFHPCFSVIWPKHSSATDLSWSLPSLLSRFFILETWRGHPDLWPIGPWCSIVETLGAVLFLKYF